MMPADKSWTKHPALPWVAAALALACLLGASFAYWRGAQERFPRLPSGAYRGIIRDFFPEPVQLYVESLAENEDVFVLLLRPDWLPQLVAASGPGAPGSGDWVFPLTISGPETGLKFTGATQGPGAYGGLVSSPGGERTGIWQLQRMPASQVDMSQDEQSRVKAWMVLSGELEDVEARIAASDRRLTEQKSEIEKLGDLVAEGNSLKTRADRKYQDVQSELAGLREELSAKRAEASKLEASILLSQRVTPTGHLVSLARESLDREWRWLEAMYRAGPVVDNKDINDAAARADELLALKKAVLLEQDRIAAIATRMGAASEAGRGGHDEF